MRSLTAMLLLVLVAATAPLELAHAGGARNVATRRLAPAHTFNPTAPRMEWMARTPEGSLLHGIYPRQSINGLTNSVISRLKTQDALILRADDVARSGTKVFQNSGIQVTKALPDGRSYTIISEHLVIKEANGAVRALRMDSAAAAHLGQAGAKLPQMLQRTLERLDFLRNYPRSLTVRGGSLGLDVLESGGRSAFIRIEGTAIPRLLPGHTHRGDSTEKEPSVSLAARAGERASLWPLPGALDTAIGLDRFRARKRGSARRLRQARFAGTTHVDVRGGTSFRLSRGNSGRW